MKGGERLFISGMWPVGREGYEPGQGVSVITDGLSIGKEDARVPGSACYFESFTWIIIFSFCASIDVDKCIFWPAIQNLSIIK